MTNRTTNNKCFTITLLLFLISGPLVFIRCTTPVEDYIPGVYISEWTTEFTQARDTISIEPSAKKGSKTYEITRRTYMIYQKTPQYKLVHWTGIFNSANKSLVINNNGRILSFDPANKVMKMGTTTYKKL